MYFIPCSYTNFQEKSEKDKNLKLTCGKLSRELFWCRCKFLISTLTNLYRKNVNFMAFEGVKLNFVIFE